MAHGKPCVAARYGGAPEVVSPACGTLVDYGNVTGLAEACVYTLNRQWDRDEIIARAAQFSYPVFRDNLAIQLSA
jgi:glycosyltransferase involved in cell wall biosynthesis